MGACDGYFGFILIGIVISPAILHGIGVFSKDWVRATSCEALRYKPSCCNSSENHTSDYSTCDGPFGLSDLNGGVFSMQFIAFFIMFTPFCCGLLDFCCSDDKDGDYEFGACAILGGCCFILYPLAGVLSFIGCMIIVNEYSGPYGKSFDFCLAVGLYVLIVTGIVIFLLYLKNKRKPKTTCGYPVRDPVVIHPIHNPSSAAPYRDVTQGIEVRSTEVTAEVHDPETGSFIRFVSKVNVYRQFRQWSS